jgi:hypothetical protein
MTSIYDAIKKDHARHRELLDTIADTTGASPERESAWDEFYHDVKSTPPPRKRPSIPR